VAPHDRSGGPRPRGKGSYRTGKSRRRLLALWLHGRRTKKADTGPNWPTSMEPYLGDALNAIVKRRAEPAFHVEVTLQKHPTTGDEYPLVRVRGTSRVPVRSDSATSGGTPKQHVYYVRAPGPESRGPLDAAEWDTLLRRAVLNQREEIVSVLRSILPSAGGLALVAASSVDDELNKFAETARIRWNSLNESLPEDHPARIKLGHFDLRPASLERQKARMRPRSVLLTSKRGSTPAGQRSLRCTTPTRSPSWWTTVSKRGSPTCGFLTLAMRTFGASVWSDIFSNSVVIRKARQTNKDGSRHRENPSRLRCRSGVSANSY